MNFEHPFADAELHTDDRPFVSEIPKLRKLATKLGLSGLANSTKWNELITHMRNIKRHDWCPEFRYCCLDSDYVAKWEAEWRHHLPFPFISVRWFEISFVERIHKGRLLDPDIVDHSSALEELLNSIGFEFEKGLEAFRIYGYAPKDRTDFKETQKHNRDGSGKA